MPDSARELGAPQTRHECRAPVVGDGDHAQQVSPAPGGAASRLDFRALVEPLRCAVSSPARNTLNARSVAIEPSLSAFWRTGTDSLAGLIPSAPVFSIDPTRGRLPPYRRALRAPAIGGLKQQFFTLRGNRVSVGAVSKAATTL
jgi:hypothetical protein